MRRSEGLSSSNVYGDFTRGDPIDSAGVRCRLIGGHERITNHTLALSDGRWRPSSAGALGPVFFPFFNITEVLLFGGICFLLAWIFKADSWLWALMVAAPVCLYVLLILSRLGFERLSQGIGTGHALSLILIPLAAVLGAMLGIRLARRRSVTTPGRS